VPGKSKADVPMLHQNNLANGPNLTARELEILEYIAQGLSTKEVAQVIDIAARTIDRHIENIRLKLRAKNRTHMVTCAVMEGLLQVENERTGVANKKENPQTDDPIDI
jgi:LuxR family transcriptional regulator of spore coat protein